MAMAHAPRLELVLRKWWNGAEVVFHVPPPEWREPLSFPDHGVADVRSLLLRHSSAGSQQAVSASSLPVLFHTTGDSVGALPLLKAEARVLNNLRVRQR